MPQHPGSPHNPTGSPVIPTPGVPQTPVALNNKNKLKASTNTGFNTVAAAQSALRNPLNP